MPDNQRVMEVKKVDFFVLHLFSRVCKIRYKLNLTNVM